MLFVRVRAMKKEKFKCHQKEKAGNTQRKQKSQGNRPLYIIKAKK